MICGPGMRGNSREDDLEEELVEVTRLLCDMCTKLDKKEHRRLMTKDLKAWWANHLEDDRLYEERRKKAVTLEQKRKKVLARLTPEEKTLLKLKDED